MPTPNIFTDIEDKGYEVFILKNADLPNYYPGTYNNYPGVKYEGHLKDRTVN